jgi:hypothetical protein
MDVSADQESRKEKEDIPREKDKRKENRYTMKDMYHPTMTTKGKLTT